MTTTVYTPYTELGPRETGWVEVNDPEEQLAERSRQIEGYED